MNNKTSFCQNNSCSSKKVLNEKKGVPANTVRFYSALSILIFGSLISAGVSSFITGLFFQIPILIIFWVFYQLYVELMIHCPRCPFWDEKDPAISCAVNCGIPKPKWQWIKKYLIKKSPQYTKNEKALMVFSNFFSVILPVLYIVLGFIYYLFVKKGNINAPQTVISGIVLLFYLICAVYFISVLFGRFCGRCINRHCPMNTTGQNQL